MSNPSPDPEPPRVTTEPQRQALDAMSQALVEKLNLMVEEQHRRVEEFTRLEHSLSQRPMEFRMPESEGSAPQAASSESEDRFPAASPQPDRLSSGTAGDSGNRASRAQAAQAPASRAGSSGRPLPPVPPIPPVPPTAPAAAARSAAPASYSPTPKRSIDGARYPSDEMPAHYGPARANDAARGSAREPGTLQGLLELLGIGGKEDSEADRSPTSTRRSAQPSRNSEGAKGCFYSLLIIAFLIIAARSCS